MSNSYIELNRLFNEIPTSLSDEKDLSDFYSLGTKNGDSWDDLLNKDRIIILAEAGSGKTVEIREQAKKLSAEKKCSFFIKIEDIKDNFEGAFEFGDISLFDTWLSGQEYGYFFLDSVDEAKIANEKDFQKALRCFSKKINKGISRAKIFITSRGSAWRPKTDFEFVENLLSLKNHDDKSNSSFKVYSFSDLSYEQIRIFSLEKGIENIDIFMEEVKGKEAEFFTRKPLDLLSVVEFWKKNQRIGSRSELLQNLLTIKLELIEVGRDKCDLSLSKVLKGVQEIAAALTFGKKSKISVPDAKVYHDVLNIHQVLPDWTNDEITTLLNRAVFEPSAYGTVSFANRLLREYLTAQWVSIKYASKGSDNKLRSLFYSTTYGIEVPIQTLKPILSWYALMNDSFAEVVANISPEVFIEEGDPSKLPIEQRQTLLEKFCEMIGATDDSFISFDANAIARFSHPDMGSIFHSLLERYSSNKQLRQILLQMALCVEAKECEDVACEISKAVEMDVLSKTLAVRLLKKVARPDVIKANASELLAAFLDTNNESLACLILDEYGNQLETKELLGILPCIVKPNKYSYRAIQSSVENYIERLNFDSILTVIDSLFGMIDTKPYAEHYMCLVSERYEWLFGCVEVALLRVIKLKEISHLSTNVLELISRAQVYHKCGSYSQHEEKIPEAVKNWKELNYQLFWHDVAKKRSRVEEENKQSPNPKSVDMWFQVRVYQEFWGFNYDDFQQAIKWVMSKSIRDDKCIAFSLAWALAKENGLASEDLEKLNSASYEFDGGVALLKGFLNPVKEEWHKEHEAQQEKFSKQREEKEELRKNNFIESVFSIKAKPEIILDIRHAVTGQINGFQRYLFNCIRNKSKDNNHWCCLNWELLTPDFGGEVALAYKNASISYWRSYNAPLLKSEGNDLSSATYGFIFALSGVGIENETIDNWEASLSEIEVKQAVKLALCEMNALPSWFEKLFIAHPLLVSSILMQETQWLLTNSGEPDSGRYVLGQMLVNGHYLFETLSRPLFDLISDLNNQSYQVNKNVLRILTASKYISNEQLASLSEYKINNNFDNLKGMWWAILVSSDAVKGVPLLSAELKKQTNEDATNLAISVLSELSNKRSYDELSGRKSHHTVTSTMELYKLMHLYIREEDDIDRTNGECYSPTSRDDAQDARNDLFNSLKEIPGEETYKALMDIAKMWNDVPYRRSWIEHLALQRVIEDADKEAMTETAFNKYSQELNLGVESTVLLTKIENNVSNNFNGPVSNSVIGDNNKDIKITQDSNKTENIPDPIKASKWHESFLGKIIVGVIIVSIGVAIKGFVS
ncbi:hypothetical protein L5M28_13095 [Shewanella sp. SW32]|uniref:NACHT domain-containing protein n=1 Tax=unclassified Shewanella TaxID=196818 RepID=UPI0021D92D03|nr:MULTISPECIES: hypothetical protein [unclassified Shewanella]MCU7963500.1 hypothetical protein [Shewanella sp. SW32]MCU7971504.1 hypothetical protein [Shewanella sp. SW29]